MTDELMPKRFGSCRSCGIISDMVHPDGTCDRCFIEDSRARLTEMLDACDVPLSRRTVNLANLMWLDRNLLINNPRATRAHDLARLMIRSGYWT